MIGPFSTTLPFRVDVDPAAFVWPWLARVQERHVEIRSYEYCSAGEIHGWSELPGTLPSTRACSFSRTSREPPRPTARVGVGRLPAPAPSAPGRATSALLAAANEGLLLRAVYDGSRIDGAAVAIVLRHFLGLLERIAAEPESRVETLLAAIPAGEIPVVTPAPVREHSRGVGAELARRPNGWSARSGRTSSVLIVSGLTRASSTWAGIPLLATQIMARLREAFAVELPLRLIFEAPTIAELAHSLEERLLAEIEELDEEEAVRLVGNDD